MADEHDPVVASYDVILSAPPAFERGSASSDEPEILVLQYPAHRPSAKPYSAARLQKPNSLKYKKKTGLVEVEVPIITTEYYNHEAGHKYGQAIAESRTISTGGSHGLVGGFNAGPVQVGSLHDIPAHTNPSARPSLANQTLGGKIARPTEKEPIYFLASLRDNAIHLSHLDAVVQMRPQLHHIDAEDENNARRLQMSGGLAGAKKAGLEITPKMESKAIEIKLKDNKEDPRDRSLNANTKLLRDIQVDPWKKHGWVDQDDSLSKLQADSLLYRQQGTESISELKSAISNGDWLDRMSAPREDGKKGLLAKLRGRERERARRRKAEEEKKRSKDTAPSADSNKGHLLEQSSDSDLSSPEVSDLEQDANEEEFEPSNNVQAPIEIKEEPEPEVVAPAPARKRGRPKKT